MSPKPPHRLAPHSSSSIVVESVGTNSAVDARARSSSDANSSRLTQWRRFAWRHDLFNWVLLAIIIVLAAAQTALPTHHRLILNPNDPAISYPLQKEQVPDSLLYVLAGALPVAIILIIFLLQRRQPHAKRELYYVLFGWIFAVELSVVITGFMKSVSGRPRPNFMAMSGYQASDGSFTASAHNVAVAFQSFPSGHASFSFTGLGYLSLYLLRLCFPSKFASRELAQEHHLNQGWKTVVCLLPLLLATWIGLTRIVDYWHNFDDVSVGAILGLAIAAVTFQLHVNWWYSSLHGEYDSPLAHVHRPSVTASSGLDDASGAPLIPLVSVTRVDSAPDEDKVSLASTTRPLTRPPHILATQGSLSVEDAAYGILASPGPSPYTSPADEAHLLARQSSEQMV